MIVTRTFLGTPPFPVAAKAALANSQLRSNMRNATHTIRDTRARVIGELDDRSAVARVWRSIAQVHSWRGNGREAAFALGKTRIATIRRVLLPSVRSDIATGATLGMGRIIGSTAITMPSSSSGPLPGLP